MWLKGYIIIVLMTEAYQGPSPTPKKKSFAAIVNSPYLLTIVAKLSILDSVGVSGYPSDR